MCALAQRAREYESGWEEGGGGGVRVSEEMRWSSAFVPHIYKHLSFLPMWLLCNVQLFGTALVCVCVCLCVCQEVRGHALGCLRVWVSLSQGGREREKKGGGGVTHTQTDRQSTRCE